MILSKKAKFKSFKKAKKLNVQKIFFMKKLINLLFIILLSSPIDGAFAQSVTIDPKAVTNGSAIIKSNATDAGMLVPRMTTAQRTAITGTQGLMVYDTTTNTFWYHNGTNWNQVISTTLTNLWSNVGQDLTYNNVGSPNANSTYSNSTNFNVPDNTSTGITSIINVPLSGTIFNADPITISMVMHHTWAGDIVATLTSPGGDNFILINRLGSATIGSSGWSGDFISTNVISFNKNASSQIADPGSNTNILAGKYLPRAGSAYSVTNLTNLFGKQVNGNWSLKIQDLSAGDTGNLVSWSINFGANSIGNIGNVGIGTSTPTARLDVAGDVNISGKINNEAIQLPTLNNGWVNYLNGYAPATFYKDKENRVHLCGLISSGTISSTAFFLPIGYRPTAIQIFSPIGSASTRIDVAPTGEVYITSGTNSFVSLSGISFRVD